MIRSTRCSVTIVTPKTALAGASQTYEFSTGGGGLGANRPGGLLSASVQVGVDRLPNTFRLVFAFDTVRGQSWGRLIPQHSLVTIEMGADQGLYEPALIMVGLTGPPGDSESYHSAQISRTTVIPGRGIEAVFADAKIWHAPYLEKHKEVIGPRLRNATFSAFGDVLGGKIQWKRQMITKQMEPREAILAAMAYYIGNMEKGLMSLGLPGGNLIRNIILPGNTTMEAAAAAYDSFVPGRTLDLNMPLGWPEDWSFLGDAIGVKMEHPTAASNPGGSMSILSMMYGVTDVNTHHFYVDYEYQGGIDRERLPACRLRHVVKPYLRDFDMANFTKRVVSEWIRGQKARPNSTERIETLTRTILDERMEPSGSLFSPDANVETIKIDDTEVGAVHLSHGQSPIYNVFYAAPLDSSLIGDTIAKADYPPEFCGEGDPSFIGRFGVRPLQYRLPFFPVNFKSNQPEGAMITTLVKVQKMLKSWFSPNPVLQEGTIRVAGSHRFRPGRRLLWVNRSGGRPPMEFEISAVSHSFDMGTGAFDSSLSVRRGIAVSRVTAGLVSG